MYLQKFERHCLFRDYFSASDVLDNLLLKSR